MIKEVDLLAYLPLFIQEYSEIQRIMNAENPEFQLVWDMNENIRNQLYIITATDQGLKRFENLLGIFPSSEDTYASRRARILTLWNDITPYTYRALLQMLRAICGDDFEVIPDFTNYAMEIITHIGFYGGIRDLAHIIENVIPVNLIITSINTLDVNASKQLFIGVTTMNTTKYFITGDFNAIYSMTGDAFNGSTLIQSRLEFITGDFNANYDMSGDIFKGSTAFNVNQIMVTNDFNGTIETDTPLNSRNTISVVTKHQI